MTSTSPSSPTPAVEHRHVWRATGIDWRSMMISYRCECGAEKEERARPHQAKEWRRKR